MDDHQAALHCVLPFAFTLRLNHDNLVIDYRVFKSKLVRPAGFEPTTPWFVARYSIQLSYGRPERGVFIT